MLNRWIQWLIKTSEIYRDNPTLVDKVLNTSDPNRVFDDYYSKDENAKLKAQREEFHRRETKLKEQIETLKKKIKELSNEEPASKPEWLTESSRYYKPKKFTNGLYYTIFPKNFYVVTPRLKRLAEHFKNLEHDEKLMRIWDYVCRNFDYRYDDEENWLLPIETMNLGKGDCEDTTSLFVTIARASGVKSDEVFNACGWFHKGGERYGHSYPIAKMSDGKWYIFESTIGQAMTPRKFKGSNYTADWGVQNWEHAGHIEEGKQI